MPEVTTDLLTTGMVIKDFPRIGWVLNPDLPRLISSCLIFSNSQDIPPRLIKADVTPSFLRN